MKQVYSPNELAERAIERRAVEAIVWGMPAVNADRMLQEMLRIGGKTNQVVYWRRPLDWHNQTLTPNPDAIYMIAFFDTKEEPVVLEIPPGSAEASLNGNVVTVWQTALEDVGLLGIDRGAGGKFVILPPGHKGGAPEGFIALPSDTFAGYALLRSNLKSHADADVSKSLAYGKRVKIYPLSMASSPAETMFVDATDVVFDATIPYDLRFFESLDRVIQHEPWIERDRAMIDPLSTIGIVKGQTFGPDQLTKDALAAAAAQARALLDHRYDLGFPPFWEKSRWTLPAPPEAIEGQATTYADRATYPVDVRRLAYTYLFVSVKRLGAGQFYLFSMRDKDGDAMEGGNTYRLTVPPQVPVQQYWSVTAYDRETHTLIRNMARPSRSSQVPGLKTNSNGSIDIWFSPTVPAGKETNWIPTDPKRRFELIFRLFGPKKEFFEKAWVLCDLEKVAAP